MPVDHNLISHVRLVTSCYIILIGNQLVTSLVLLPRPNGIRSPSRKSWMACFRRCRTRATPSSAGSRRRAVGLSGFGFKPDGVFVSGNSEQALVWWCLMDIQISAEWLRIQGAADVDFLGVGLHRRWYRQSHAHGGWDDPTGEVLIRKVYDQIYRILIDFIGASLKLLNLSSMNQPRVCAGWVDFFLWDLNGFADLRPWFESWLVAMPLH